MSYIVENMKRFKMSTSCNKFLFAIANSREIIPKKSFRFPRLCLAKNMKKSVAAFTLAETLLTLVIVGIVAALTIPAAIHQAEKVSLHTAFLKAYSTAEQAHKVMMRENGGSLDGATLKVGTAVSTFIADAFSAQLMCTSSYTVKTATHPNYRNKCWNDKIYYPQGSSTTSFPGGFTTQDGMFWQYNSIGNGSCTSTTMCFRLAVDVNGFKKPNVIGRDIFYIDFFADRLLPLGAPGTSVSGVLCAWGSGWPGPSCAYYELLNKPKVGYLKDY